MNKLSGYTLAILAVIALSAQAATSDQVVHARLWDQAGKMGIDTDLTKVRAGKIDFEVKNDSATLTHEMLVIKVADYADPLPYSTRDARIIEDDTVDIGEVSELEPGHSGNLIVDLKPGNYLLVCNVPGHYKSHMLARLQVVD